MSNHNFSHCEMPLRRRGLLTGGASLAMWGLLPRIASAADEKDATLAFTSVDKNTTCELTQYGVACTVTEPTWPKPECPAPTWVVRVDGDYDTAVAECKRQAFMRRAPQSA